MELSRFEGGFDLEIDTSGLTCPLPILRAKKALATLQSGQVLKVITTDKKALKDFEAFTSQTKNELLQQKSENDFAVHFIRRR